MNGIAPPLSSRAGEPPFGGAGFTPFAAPPLFIRFYLEIPLIMIIVRTTLPHTVAIFISRDGIPLTPRGRYGRITMEGGGQ